MARAARAIPRIDARADRTRPALGGWPLIDRRLALAAALALGPTVAVSARTPSAAPSQCADPAAAAVELALIGPPERRTAAREVLTELVAPRVAVRWSELDEADVSAAIRLAAAEDPALAHVYVDLRGAPLLVSIGDRGHARVLVRRVALPASFDEAAREEIGAIVSSALDALCAGGTIGILRAQALPTPEEPPPPRPSPPPPEPAPTPPRDPRPRWSGGVQAGYRLSGWAPQRPQHAIELGASLRRRRGRVDPQASLWVGALPPIAWSSDSPRIGGALVRAELAAVVRLAPRWSTLVAASGGLELLRAAGERARPVALPIVQAGLGLRAGLGRGVVAELRGHVAVDLVDTRVIAATDGRLLFDPWRVRPGVSLVFGWTGAP